MKIPPWSYSSLTSFENCPRQYKLLKIDKIVPFKETESIRFGNEVHKALERRVRDKTPLPSTMLKYEKIAAKLDRPGVFVEQEIALTRNLDPCGWWDKTCWTRGKIDVGIKSDRSVLVADYKTGKVSPESSQLELFAAMKMTEDRTIERAKTMFIWLAHDKTTVKDIHRDDVPAIWEGFISRSNRLDHAFQTDKWIPRPSGLCKPSKSGYPGCPVGKKNCEFCGID
jgi:hypothetical protein